MRIAVTTAVALLAATTAFAQDEAARRVATEVAARASFERALKGAPYSAETIVEGSQTLADGNKITSKTTGRVYRDSEGRTRREEDRKNGTTSISISDPVAGFSYSLDPVDKIAWRTAIGGATATLNKLETGQQAGLVRKVEPVRTTAPDGSTVIANQVTLVESSRAEAEKIQVEQARAVGTGGARGAGGGYAAIMPATRGGAAASTPLEHKVVDGLAVEGRSTTTMIPAGQVGNDQPITILDEQWRSSDLNVLVTSRHVDPRSGESSYKLLNVVRAEPDASLFMVPPDYTVKAAAERKMIERQAAREPRL